MWTTSLACEEPGQAQPRGGSESNLQTAAGDGTGQPHFPLTARKIAAGFWPCLPHSHPWGLGLQNFRALFGVLARFTLSFLIFFKCYLNAIKIESAKGKSDRPGLGRTLRAASSVRSWGKLPPLSLPLDSRSSASPRSWRAPGKGERGWERGEERVLSPDPESP